MNKVIVAALGAGLAASAGAQVVHDNITVQTSTFQGITNFDPQLSMVDDLLPDAGGELASLTFTYGYSGGFGGPGAIMLNVSTALYLDDGDGVFDPTADAVLHQSVLSDLTAVQGELHQATVQFAPGIVISSGARLWWRNGYEPDTFNFVNLGVGLFNDYAAGGSDSNIYVYDSDLGTTQTFFQADGAGAGAVLRLVPSPSALALFGSAGLLGLRRRR